MLYICLFKFICSVHNQTSYDDIIQIYTYTTVILWQCCSIFHLSLTYRAKEGRVNFPRLKRSFSTEEASIVFEDTTHLEFPVQSDMVRMPNSAASLVHQSHFYENFGDVDFWRKPSISHTPLYEVPVRWTGLSSHVSKNTRRGRSYNDSSHPFTLSDAAVDAVQEKWLQASSHPLRPRKRSISVTLPIPSRKIDTSTDGGIIYYYDNVDHRVSGHENGISKIGEEENELKNQRTLPKAGLVYEMSYITMHSAHCTSCPSLPDLEDDLYVAMDVAQSPNRCETSSTSARYYNVPAKLAGIPGTYFMPGPLYHLPSSHPTHSL